MTVNLKRKGPNMFCEMKNKIYCFMKPHRGTDTFLFDTLNDVKSRKNMHGSLSTSDLQLVILFLP